MPRVAKQNDSAPFQRIPAACRITGLSQSYLRAGCKDGSVPHIMSGAVPYINVPELLKKLNRESTAV